MGFMEGFANSFGRQMEQGAAQRAQAKRDVFQIAYDQYINKKTQYDKDVRADQEAIANAKAITASVPGVPEGAWEHTYQWLLAGYTPGQAEEKLRSTQFASQEQPAMPDKPSEAATAQTAQDTQMADSGLAPGQEQTTGQQDPDLMGSIFGADGLLNPQANQERMMERANQQVMSGAGIDQTQFDQIQAGYQRAPLSGNAPAITGTIASGGELNPNDAVWLEVNGKWTQGYVSQNGATDLSGNPVEPTSVRTNEQFTQIRNVLGSIPKAPELMEQKANTINLIENVSTLAGMAQENPNVLTRAINLSVGLSAIGNEINSVFSQINSLTDQDLEASEVQVTDALAQALEAEGTNPSDAQRYAALAIGVKFDLARAMSGPGVLSEADRQAGEQALATNDPNIFLQIAQDLAKKSVRTTNVLANQIAGSPQVAQALSIEGVDLGTLFNPVEEGLSDNAVAWLQQASTAAPTNGAASGQPTQSEPQGEVLDVGQVTYDMVQSMPELFSEDDIGKPYRKFANGYDVQE